MYILIKKIYSIFINKNKSLRDKLKNKIKSFKKLIDRKIKKYFESRSIKLWEKSKLNQINRNNIKISCPYCKSEDSINIFKWNINDHFGIFDDNIIRCKKIYLTNPFISLLISNVNELRFKILKYLTEFKSYIIYLKCNNCGLVYQNYPHTQKSASFYYKKLFRLFWEKSLKKNGPIIYGRDDERWVKKVELIGKVFIRKTKLAPDSKILDLGCAEGIVCKFLEEQGMKSYGIEPSLPMINYAKLILKQEKVTCASYKISSYPKNFFDGIITFHVAEHVIKLEEFFEGIKIQLKSNGYLLIMVPCIDNVKKEEDYEKEILCGTHIYGFSERFLHNILISKGFIIEESIKTPLDLLSLDESLVTLWGVTIWADKPGGLSILAKKK